MKYSLRPTYYLESRRIADRYYGKNPVTLMLFIVLDFVHIKRQILRVYKPQ